MEPAVAHADLLCHGADRPLLDLEARNQMPTTLLFRGGVLVDRRLGAQTFEQLRDWVRNAAQHH
jgi:hypothetical protein